MNLYLDTGSVEEVGSVAGLIKGVTTTPSLLKKHGVEDVAGTLRRISHLTGEVHVEALGRDWGETLDVVDVIVSKLEGDPNNYVFKVPATAEGLKACVGLTNAGYKVNMHLVYKLDQAYLAMAAGASFVCPLIGRAADNDINAIELIADIIDLRDRGGYKTKVMASSIRNPSHVFQAASVGADACTVPYKILLEMADHPLTMVGVETLWKDHEALQVGQS